MQRKGISIDEVLDLFAIRILVEDDIDCYKVLGYMHLEFKPLISRFKNYVATPKENGYQTIHTTVFYNSKIYEIQIRSFEMNKIAEFGIAAHWKYKGIRSEQGIDQWMNKIRELIESGAWKSAKASRLKPSNTFCRPSPPIKPARTSPRPPSVTGCWPKRSPRV